MPRFYLKVQDQEGVVPGDIGINYDDESLAIAEARAALIEMAREGIPQPDKPPLCIDISDEQRVPLYTICLQMNLTVHARS